MENKSKKKVRRAVLAEGAGGRAAQAAAALRKRARPDRKAILQGFFKTGPGEYAEGDRFLGVYVPDARRVAQDFRLLPASEVDILLRSGWHEDRLLGLLILVDRFVASRDEKERSVLYRHYMARLDRVNNWDLVDLSAPQIVGGWLERRDRSVLYRLARSRDLWRRRVAVVATLAFIRRGDFGDILSLAERLLGDPHDLMHKAVGWMLREVGKRDESVLKAFLDRHAARMPSVMRRYAVERLPPAERERYAKVARIACFRPSPATGRRGS